MCVTLIVDYIFKLYVHYKFKFSVYLRQKFLQLVGQIKGRHTQALQVSESIWN